MEVKVQLLAWITIQLVILLVLQECFQQTAAMSTLKVRTRRDAEATTGAPAAAVTTPAAAATVSTTAAPDGAETPKPTVSPDDTSKATGGRPVAKPTKAPKKTKGIKDFLNKGESVNNIPKSSFLGF